MPGSHGAALNTTFARFTCTSFKVPVCHARSTAPSHASEQHSASANAIAPQNFLVFVRGIIKFPPAEGLVRSISLHLQNYENLQSRHPRAGRDHGRSAVS